MELTPQEREHLVQLLENEHRELLHELHHTKTRAFVQTLRTRIDVNEMLQAKLEPALMAV